MDLIGGIVQIFTLSNLAFCFIGCVMGTAVGVLPGLGPTSTLSILFPFTLYLDPTGSIIMLAGICYGAQYGGSTTSILVNIPGEVASVATCLDGFQMTRQGRAGQALWIAAVGSFVAGTLGVLGLSLIGPSIAKYALAFGPPEYFGLMLLSLTMMISLSGTSLIKGISAGLVGILVATVGVDALTGISRFNFGSVGMMRGFEIIPVVVGLFGIAEILVSVGDRTAKLFEGQLGKMRPKGKELGKGLAASLRGTAIGFVMGLLPGMTSGVTAFLAYDAEKKISKHPEKFGTGVIEGVAAPEAANNATSQAGFIPLFALGIPTSPSMAIILAALILYGLQPGPMLFVVNKDFIWTIIASMYLGNVMLLILNLPLVGVWARISLIPYKYLAPVVLAICIVGAYAPRNTMFDVWVALGAGVLGYIMRKTDWPTAPLVLGFILGPMFEQALRRSLSMGSPMVFFERPIALGFILLSIITMTLVVTFLKRVPEEVRKDVSDR